MSLNFYFDLCALIITITLIFADFFKKTTSGRTNRLFVYDLFMVFGTACCKLAYTLILATLSYSVFSRTLAYFFVYLYVIFDNLVIVFFIFYLFSSLGIASNLKKNKPVKIIIHILIMIPFLFMMSNIFTKRIFFITGGMEYYENPVIVFFYITQALLFIVIAFTLIVYRKDISKEKMAVGIIILLVNSVFMFVQLINNGLQLQLFVYSISGYLVLLFTQRPELLINPIVNAKSANCFMEETRQSFTLKRKNSVIFVKLLNNRNTFLYLGQDNYNSFLRSISEKLHDFTSDDKDVFEIYYPSDSLFALMTESDNFDYICGLAQKINTELYQKTNFAGFDLFPEYCVSVVNIPEDITNFERFESFTFNFHSMFGKSDEPFIVRNFAESRDFKIKNEIETILRKAFEEKNFEVFYQPIWDVKEKKFISAEALIRLKDPVYNYISPSIFIPAAESSGLIFQVGEYVFAEVCKFISSPEFSEAGLKYIEINLSTSQLVELKLIDKIIQNLNDYGVAPEQIRFEITENAADINPVIAEQNILGLHELGFSFALDDYGTGYSNIKKVTGLPLDAIKLDKAFVDEMDNPVMWTVIQDTVHMLKQLKKEVFVEGIETKEAAVKFEELGCQSIQGYFYSKPLQKDLFLDFVRNNP